MLSETARAVARLVAIDRGEPVVVREVADVVPRPDAGWLALATMPADGRVWAGAARLPHGDVLQLSVLEPRSAAMERDGLRRLGEFFDRLAAAHLAESVGDYPQVVVPDEETPRALKLIYARFRADADPALRRLCWQIAFFLDAAKLDGADALVDLRTALTDHLVWPLAPAEERDLARLVDPVPACTVSPACVRQTAIDDVTADRLSDLLIGRAKAIQRGLPPGRYRDAEAEVEAALREHATWLLDLTERGLRLWRSLDLVTIDCSQSRALTSDYAYRRGKWVADEPPFLPARRGGSASSHDLLKREAATERRRYHLTMADGGLFEESLLTGEAARATLIERAAPRRLELEIRQPALRLRHGDPVEARNVPGLRGRLAETGDGAGRFALRLDNGVRRAAALPPGATLELVRTWEDGLTRKRHQCLRLWDRAAAEPPELRRPRPRPADAADWYAARRAGSSAPPDANADTHGRAR